MKGRILEDRKKIRVHQRKALPPPPSISSGSCFGAMPELWLGMGGVEGFPVAQTVKNLPAMQEAACSTASHPGVVNGCICG